MKAVAAEFRCGYPETGALIPIPPPECSGDRVIGSHIALRAGPESRLLLNRICPSILRTVGHRGNSGPRNFASSHVGFDSSRVNRG